MSKLTMKKCAGFVHFNNLNELARHCEQDKEGHRRQSESNGFTFCHTHDFDEASRLMREGWPEGVQQIIEAMAVIADGLDGIEVKESEMDVVGPVPIVGAYLSGDPECMFNPAVGKQKPVVNICIDACTSCAIGTNQMINRGAALLALAQALEDAGREVAIFMSYAVSSFDRQHWIGAVTMIKRAGEPFNLHGLSYAMAQPSFVRRHMFRVHELMDSKGAKEALHDSYGTPTSFKSIEGIGAATGDIDFYLEGIDNHCYAMDTPEEAIAFIREEAVNQGILSC